VREVGYRNMRGEDLSATDDDEDERDERAFDAFNGQEKGHHRHTRDSSVTFFTGNENEREMLVGTPRTNFRADEEGGEEEEGDNDNRRKSLDGYERSKSFDKPRRGGGLSAAFSDFDLTASSIEKPPRVPPKEFLEEVDTLRDKFDTDIQLPETGQLLKYADAGAESPPVAFYAYSQSPRFHHSVGGSPSPRVHEGTFLGSSPRSLGTSPGSYHRGGIMGRSGPKPLSFSASPNGGSEAIKQIIGFDGAGFKNARERYFEECTKFLQDRFSSEEDYENTWISLRSKSKPSLFGLCKKPLTMKESYQEFFLDHLDVFELSRDERYVRLIKKK